MRVDVERAPAPQAVHKIVATQAARAALCGWVLQVLDDGSAVASRWGRQVSLANPDAIERFLARIEGAAA